MPEYVDKDKVQDEFLFASCWNNADRDVFWDLVDAMPAADVAPIKHGFWKEFDSFMPMECSACGYKNYNMGSAKYCPDCGAMMDGGVQRWAYTTKTS